MNFHDIEVVIWWYDYGTWAETMWYKQMVPLINRVFKRLS